MSYSKLNYNILWLSFIIMPVLPLLYAIKNFEVRRYRIFILLFAMLAGYSFIPTTGGDAFAYQDLFKEYTTYGLGHYLDVINIFFSTRSGVTDLYSNTILFLVSRFTSDSNIFFMVVALIYYFAFIKLLDLVISLQSIEKHNSSVYFFLGCVFIFSLTLGINGIRWALAFVVFSYGTLKMIMSGKILHLLIVFLAVLIHFSFLYSTYFIILYLIIKRIQNKWILYGFLFLSLLLLGSISEVVISIIGSGNEVIDTRLQAYTNQSFMTFRTLGFQNASWFIKFDRYSTYYFAIIALILSRFSVFKLTQDSLSKGMFAFCVLMLVQSIISGAVVDPFSNRYYLLVNFFVLVYLIYLGSLNPIKGFLKYTAIIFVPILVLHIILVLRTDLDHLSTFLLTGNIFSIFIMDTDKSIWNILNGWIS